MINPTREQVAVALFSLLQTVPGFASWSRRPQLWDKVANFPALFMGNPAENYQYDHGNASPPVVTIDFDIFIYISVGQDPNVIPDTLMNTLLDSIEVVMTPLPSAGYAQTLGGIVHHAWIEGPINRAPGYIDGRGLALLTIKVLVPQ